MVSFIVIGKSIEVRMNMNPLILFSKAIFYDYKLWEDWLTFYKRPVFLKIFACCMICRNNDKSPGDHYEKTQFNALIAMLY